MSRTSGFTLVEIMVALVLGGLVVGLSVGVLVGQRRVWWQQMWRTDGHATSRLAQLVIAAEFRGTLGDSGVSGISALTTGSAVYRAVRSLHFSCSAALVGDSVISAWDARLGSRNPDPTVDSLLVLESAGTGVGRWRSIGFRGVSFGLCPDGQRSVSFQLNGPIVGAVDKGAPIRAFETGEIRAYQSRSVWWIGMRRAKTAGRWPSIQPAFGPISTRGLELTAFDKSLVPTATPQTSVAIEFRVGLRHPFRSGVNSWRLMAVRQRNAP